MRPQTQPEKIRQYRVYAPIDIHTSEINKHGCAHVCIDVDATDGKPAALTNECGFRIKIQRDNLIFVCVQLSVRSPVCMYWLALPYSFIFASDVRYDERKGERRSIVWLFRTMLLHQNVVCALCWYTGDSQLKMCTAQSSKQWRVQRPKTVSD